jgi:hypothetical protein
LKTAKGTDARFFLCGKFNLLCSRVAIDPQAFSKRVLFFFLFQLFTLKHIADGVLGLSRFSIVFSSQNHP